MRQNNVMAEVTLMQNLSVVHMPEARFYRLHVFTQVANFSVDARNSAMVTVLANMARLHQEDPDFISELAEVAFVPSASGQLHQP
eukprot:SAG25_NODE_4384_length_827_cov_0.905220_2_plen_84_part_01